MKARIVFALDRPATAAEYPRVGRAVVAELARRAGAPIEADAACMKLEQPIFTLRKGAAKWRLDGGLIDVDRAARINGNGPDTAITTAGCKSENPADGARIPAGKRNATLTAIAGALRRRGLSPAAIEAAILAENGRCDPPLPEAEARRIAASVSRYEPGQLPHLLRGYGVPEPDTAPPRLLIKRAADVAPQPIRWLWPGRIALGKVTVFSGDPGLGKSMLQAAFAGHISTARAWPDGAPCGLGDVLIPVAEDDAADTIRPRLDATGADVTRVHLVQGVEARDRQGNMERRLLSLRHDVAALTTALAELPAARLAVIDPVSAYLDGADSHNNAEVRALLAPLSEAAAATGCALILVSHLNKGGSGTSALYRTTGSLAFVAAARAAYVVTRDPLDGERRLLLPMKNNIGPGSKVGLAYRIAEANGVPFVAWDGIAELSADEALGGSREEDTESTLADQAGEWLRELLERRDVPVKEVRDAAQAAGYSWATMRRAQAALGVRPVKVGFDRAAHWVWRFGTGPAAPELIP